MERGLEHLMRALALFPALDLLVLFSAAMAAERAALAFNQLLPPTGLPVAGDGMDWAAFRGWSDASTLSSGLRGRLPRWPTFEVFRALLLAPTSNDVATGTLLPLDHRRDGTAGRGRR